MGLCLVFEDFEVSGEDIPDGLIGEIMICMMMCDSYFCSSKKAYLELVENMAKAIVEKVLDSKRVINVE